MSWPKGRDCESGGRPSGIRGGIGEKYMVIDFHTHTFPDKVAAKAIPRMEQEIAANGRFGTSVRARLSGTAAGLSESTKKNDIDLSVVLPVATAPRQTESINRYAAAFNQSSSTTRLLSFGAIHPDNENYREILRGLKEQGIRGIKLHPDYQGVYFDDPRYLHIMDCAAELDLVIVTHAGIDVGKPRVVYCTPDMICRVDDCLRYPKLVLAHLGGWNLWNEVEEKLLGRALYLDTAICFDRRLPHVTKEQFRRFVEKHGSGRILFGTDSPWTDPGESIAAVKAAGLPEEQEEAILGGNARGLLKLDAQNM